MQQWDPDCAVTSCEHYAVEQSDNRDYGLWHMVRLHLDEVSAGQYQIV